MHKNTMLFLYIFVKTNIDFLGSQSKIKKANLGLKKNRKKVITLIVAALAFTMTGCGQFNRNFSIGINSGKQTGYPVYD